MASDRARPRLSRAWLWAAVGIVAAGAAALAWAAASAGERADLVWRRIQERGVFTVATDASYPPFAAVDEHGALFGFDIDLAEAMAQHWGVRAEFENIAYDALLSTLVSGRDDAVISAFVPQPERAKEILFTRPYFVGGVVLVAPAGRAAEWATDPLGWASGRTIAVEYGSDGYVLARQWSRRLADVTVLSESTPAGALAAVEQGAADVGLVDALSAYDFLLGHPDLVLAGPPLEPEPYAIAVSADSRELFRALAQALDALEADGTLAALRVKWFGEAARTMPTP